MTIIRNDTSSHEESLDLQLSSAKSQLDLIIQLLDAELRCPICHEFIRKAINLNCSHVFCDNCLESWIKNSNICPTCRTRYLSKTRVLTIDNIVSRLDQILGRSKDDENLTDDSSTIVESKLSEGPYQFTRNRTRRRNAISVELSHNTAANDLIFVRRRRNRIRRLRKKSRK